MGIVRLWEGAETLPYMIVHILRQLRNVEDAVPYMIVHILQITRYMW